MREDVERYEGNEEVAREVVYGWTKGRAFGCGEVYPAEERRNDV